MVVFSNPELIKALADWVGQLKNPYTRHDEEQRPPVKLMSSSPGVWLEIRQQGQNRLEISCIHIIQVNTKPDHLPDMRRECRQFNMLMERIRLPVIIWEDREREEFQLRWQEILDCGTDLKYVHHLMAQSLYMANALQGRLGWALKSPNQPLAH